MKHRKHFFFYFAPIILLSFLCCSSSAFGYGIIYEWDFEDGWGTWAPNNGVWQVGIPTSGPGMAHSSDNCAGTILDGNYPQSTISRLISPVIDLPEIGSGDEIICRLWEHFSYALEHYDDDTGEVQVRVYENGAWSDWVPHETNIHYSSV